MAGDTENKPIDRVVGQNVQQRPYVASNASGCH